jgi:hypothetical protein
VGPGSVGLPYEGERGAFWALLGPDVDLRRTDYEVDAAVERMRETDDPRVEQIVELMLEPPSRDEAIEQPRASSSPSSAGVSLPFSRLSERPAGATLPPRIVRANGSQKVSPTDAHMR